jgi:predicted cytidylate kinase
MTRVICISGDAASGKTTAAKRVLERLPRWRIVSTGARFREYCAQHGIDPQQISHLGDTLHRNADADMLSVLTSESRIIAEGRVVGYLAREIPDALRVFCTCPLEVRADRFRQREPAFSAEEARSLVAERDAADTRNFLHLYSIDYHDPRYYDLVVDTATLAPNEVADAILRRLAS